MEQIFNEYGYPLDMSKIELLSNEGSEFIVYRYLDSVLKLYKKGYPLTHLSLEELNFLKGIITQRILLPTGTLWSGSQDLLGYEMPIIIGARSIENDSVNAFFQELEVLMQDLSLLCQNAVMLRDVNLSNTIYNGHLYLIDPGNYLIGQLDKIITLMPFDASSIGDMLIEILKSGDYSQIKPLVDSLPQAEKQDLANRWNYDKINNLLDKLLFRRKGNIDSFTYCQIVQFLMKEREKNGFIYNLDVFKLFFNSDLCIGEAIDDFVGRYIEDDPEERKIFYRL